MSKKPTVLMILDGYGLRDEKKGNGIAEANTPVMDKLMAEYPFVKGNASGLAVGLPDGQMGNSEVGHMNMGAGRIIYQELTKITKAIDDGDFFENKALLAACENAKKNGTALHLMGLVSDGGVHSHITHIYGILELAKRQGLDKVYVHCFLDGRDTPPASGKEYVEQLEAKMKEIGVGEVASVSGRYYAMDRDNRWDRVEKAYAALTRGEGDTAASATEGIQASYDKEVTDEFVVPFVVTKNGTPVATVKDGDSVIFFNFRPDRAREITRTFCADDFDGFARGERIKTTYVCFTEYDETIPNKMVAFVKEGITNTFGEFLAANNMTQARIAETEKYAHVTFFINGGVEEPNKGEDRILVKSPKVATYDLKPEMSAYEVCDKLVGAIKSEKYDVIVIEGAGSPAEINLKKDDIVNMGMAELVDAPVLLVGDIDRGGVFAQIAGTVMLLEEKERKRIAGTVINKFRGDVSILEPGLKMLEDRTDIPVLGVVPYFYLDLDEEDSLTERFHKKEKPGLVDIAVIRFPRISNFTDLAPLEAIEEVSVRYISSPADFGQPDLVILPGSKNTISDLLWMRQNGLEAKILRYSGNGGAVFGICGGYQMLGRKIQDPDGIEEKGTVQGLGLLPVCTVFGQEKRRTRVEGKFRDMGGILKELQGIRFNGYEIHMGRSEVDTKSDRLVSMREEGNREPQGYHEDGAQNGNVYGCYVHGIFDEKLVSEGIVSAILKQKGCGTLQIEGKDWNSYKEEQYDQLADILRESLDMKAIYKMME